MRQASEVRYALPIRRRIPELFPKFFFDSDFSENWVTPVTRNADAASSYPSLPDGAKTLGTQAPRPNGASP
jgi:hypothetical protein